MAQFGFKERAKTIEVNKHITIYFHIPPCSQKDLSQRRSQFTKTVTTFTSIPWSQKERAQACIWTWVLKTLSPPFPKIGSRSSRRLKKESDESRLGESSAFDFLFRDSLQHKAPSSCLPKVSPPSRAAPRGGEHVCCAVCFSDQETGSLDSRAAASHANKASEAVSQEESCVSARKAAPSLGWSRQ